MSALLVPIYEILHVNVNKFCHDETETEYFG